MTMRAAVPMVALVVVAACARPSAGGAPPSAKSATAERATSTTSVVASAPAPVPALAPVTADVFDAVRSGDFRAAALLLDAAHDVETAPELRYLRARVALELGEYAKATPLLAGLDEKLPLLRPEILRGRALAALQVGPYDDAFRYFSARPDAESWRKAALAKERAGDLPAAHAWLDRVVGRAAQGNDAESRRVELSARADRTRVARAQSDLATVAKDLRYLAVEAPASDAAKGADVALAQMTPPILLTIEERLSRAKDLAEAGRVDDALAEVDRANDLPGAKARAAELVRARAFVYYLSRADYGKATELFDQASKLDDKERAHDSFYAARALSRSGDDAQAITRYEALARAYPGTTFGDEAEYLSARLRFLLGQWDGAANGYRAYLAKSKPKKRRRFDAVARYELALTAMAAKRSAEAAPLFHDLADREDDPTEKASLRELEGAALLDENRRAAAVETLTGVMKERPLSLPALASAARLATVGVVSVTFPPDPSVLPAVVPINVELPEKVALLAHLGLARDAEAELSAHENEFVARYAPRGYEALCEAYGKIGGGPERYRVGRRVVKGDALDHAPTEATRWAWDCVYPTPFDGVVDKAEHANALPAGLLYAVMRQESAFQSGAVSPANAVGLLQLVPDTAERAAHELGLEHTPELLLAPARNVEIGAHYLKRVLTTFGDNVVLGAAAYNAGPRAVSRWLASAETLPLDVWAARIPFVETREYVSRVVGNLARYAYLRGGEDAVPKLSLSLPQGLRASPDDY
ncbi:MAG TPA: lytic transglycosylase domain-containing protein [Polyangiaceae bacterium]|nr:lytic transglycosylase domain-containing protein [Polyangiaceae bacterium]